MTDAHASRKPWFSLVVDGSSAGLELLVGSFDVFCVRVVELFGTVWKGVFNLNAVKDDVCLG